MYVLTPLLSSSWETSDGQVGYGISARSPAVDFVIHVSALHSVRCICTPAAKRQMYLRLQGVMFFNVRDGDGTARYVLLLPDLVTQQTSWNACGSVWCAANARRGTGVCTRRWTVHLQFTSICVHCWLLGLWYTCFKPLCKHRQLAATKQNCSWSILRALCATMGLKFLS